MRYKKMFTLLCVSLLLVIAISGCENKDAEAQVLVLPPQTQLTTATPEPQLGGDLPTAEPDLDDEMEIDPLSAFEEKLKDSILTRDFELMPALMPESFGFALWRSEGYSQGRDQAVEDLKANYFNDEFEVKFATPPDLSSDLPDGDILRVWDPAANPISAIFTTGLGADGLGEAFLIIAEPEDLTFHWVGVIFAPQGFELP